MKKKILIELVIETDKNFDTIENAIIRGLDYGFEKYEVTEEQTMPEVRVYNI